MSRPRLAGRAKDRDAAFAEFVAARRSHLRRIAYAVCGDWHRADDLLQTALVKLYVAWPRRAAATAARRRTCARIIVRANIDESPAALAPRASAALDGHDRGAPAGLGVEERSALFDGAAGAADHAAQGGAAAALARALGRGDRRTSSASPRARSRATPHAGWRRCSRCSPPTGT